MSGFWSWRLEYEHIAMHHFPAESYWHRQCFRRSMLSLASLIVLLSAILGSVAFAIKEEGNVKRR